MKLIYHDCGWTYWADAEGVAMANQCPHCGGWGLSFAVDKDPQVLRDFCREKGIEPPAWLVKAALMARLGL